MTKNKFIKFFDNNIINITIFFVFLFVIYLIFKLYNLQVIEGEKYNEIIKNKQLGYFQRKINDKRGTIFFKNNTDNINTVVAVDMPVFDIQINPKKIEDQKYTYNILKKYIKIDPKDYFQKVNKKNTVNQFLARSILPETIKNIKKEYKNNDLFFVKRNKRVYPLEENSSKVLGFTNHKYKGVYGLEKYYDDILHRNSENYLEKKIFSYFSTDEKKLKDFSQKNISKEGDLYSSIDVTVSDFSSKILQNINKKYNSKYSGLIIMKPKTGQIITMTDTDILDINKNKKDYRNKFIEYRYEVGSVFKILVAAIGLETKSINKNFSYNDKGCIQIKQATFCNYDKKSRGQNTNLKEILIQSLNTGMIEIEKKIGHKLFFSKLLELGLAEETGIDLPNEASSNISTLNEYNPVNYAASSFGQSTSFTPIGITKALSSIASDGYLTTPNIISKIKYGGLIPDYNFKPNNKQIFSPKTIKIIKDIMIERSDRFLENNKKYNKNYNIATKSGTAQIADRKNGGYLKGKNIHTFFGFFPAYGKIEDRFSIFLYTIEPKKVKYSSESLSDPFFKITDFLIKYYRIPPDRISL